MNGSPVTAAAMMEHVSVLADRFPHRHTGEPDERGAAEYIAATMRDVGLAVTVHELSVMGWELTAEPSLEILDPDGGPIECVPFIFSGSTPPEGLTGRLEYVGPTMVVGIAPPWEKFALVDDAGRPRAFVVGRPTGPAIAQSGPPAGFAGTEDGPHYTWPACVVGRDDLALLKQADDAGRPLRARLRIASRHKPGCTSFVVQGDLAGADDDGLVVVGAHHDSMGASGFPAFADSPGACDNASGVAAVIELARHFRDAGHAHTLRFCTYGGEEWNLTGSRHYVRMLTESGELAHVRAKVNVDQTAGGERLLIHASGPMTAIARTEVDRLALAERYDIAWHIPPTPGSDHWPYHRAGVPVFYALWDPIAHYHRAGDVPAACADPTRYEDAVALIAAAISAVGAGSAGVVMSRDKEMSR
jgi:hypothetical protein